MRTHCLCVAAALCGVLSRDSQARQRPPASCEQLETAVRANPDNPELATALGRCVVRDYELVAPGGDSSRLAFRSSWAPALRALRHAVTANPGYAAAYRPLMRMLFADTRDGCSFATGLCEFVASVVRSGDSLLTAPKRVRLNVHPDSYEDAQRESAPSQPINLAEARDLAMAWAAATPNDFRPREYLGRALLGLGEAASAANELEQAAALSTVESRRALFWDRIEALIKSNRGEDARRVLDDAERDPGRDTTQLRSHTITALNALLGRNRPAPVDTIAQARMRARIDSMLRQQAAAPRPPRPRTIRELIAARDTAGARREIARHDSALAPVAGRRNTREGEELLHSAEEHLAVGDTVGAEAQLARIEQFFNYRPFRYNFSLLFDTGPWIGNAWLLTGNLMASRRRPAEARKMYQRLIGLWGGADQQVKPLVDEARGRLDALEARSR
jgi:hypothetical protein